MRRLNGFPAALLLAAYPCAATVTVSPVAGGSIASGTSSKSTSVTGLVAGDLVLVSAGQNGASTFTISDNQGGTWTALNAVSGGPSVKSFFRRITGTAPTTIAVAFTDTADNGRITIIKVSGLYSPTLDVNGSWSTGTGSAPTIATGALANANEVVIGVADEPSTNNAWSTTTAAGWGQVNAQTYGGRQATYSTIVTSTNSVTFNPTVASSVYAVNVYSFTGTVAPPPPTCMVGGLSMLGAGC